MEGTNSSEANPTTDLVSEEENDELVTAKKPETFSSAGKMFILPQGIDKTVPLTLCSLTHPKFGFFYCSPSSLFLFI